MLQNQFDCVPASLECCVPPSPFELFPNGTTYVALCAIFILLYLLQSIEDLKALVISQLPRSVNVPGGGRFRINDHNIGLQPPLYEQLTVEKAGISEKSELVFEGGVPPAADEVSTIFFGLYKSASFCNEDWSMTK